MARQPLLTILPLLFVFAAFSVAHAVSVTWAGHTWNVTTGGLAGGNTGSAANVFVDSSGYLHLKIAQVNGKWYCAEVFSADNIGFGTYQWQIDGPVDKLDKNVVLGLYPYGPEAGIGADATNEIDIEYARWGNAAWPNGNYTVYPNSGTTVGSTTFNFTMTGTYTTSTFVWSATSIVFKSQEGFKAVGDNTGMIKTWTYAPTNPSVNIPQRAMPLGMNLWLCSDCGGAPSDGKPVEIIIRSFVYLAPGVAVKSGPQPIDRRNELSVVQNNRTALFNFASPVPREQVFTIADLMGRVEKSVAVPAGTGSLSVQGIPAGIHIISAPIIGTAQKTFYFR